MKKIILSVFLIPIFLIVISFIGMFIYWVMLSDELETIKSEITPILNKEFNVENLDIVVIFNDMIINFNRSDFTNVELKYLEEIGVKIATRSYELYKKPLNKIIVNISSFDKNEIFYNYNMNFNIKSDKIIRITKNKDDFVSGKTKRKIPTGKNNIAGKLLEEYKNMSISVTAVMGALIIIVSGSKIIDLPKEKREEKVKQLAKRALELYGQPRKTVVISITTYSDGLTRMLDYVFNIVNGKLVLDKK